MYTNFFFVKQTARTFECCQVSFFCWNWWNWSQKFVYCCLWSKLIEIKSNQIKLKFYFYIHFQLARTFGNHQVFCRQWSWFCRRMFNCCYSGKYSLINVCVYFWITNWIVNRMIVLMQSNFWSIIKSMWMLMVKAIGHHCTTHLM